MIKRVEEIIEDGFRHHPGKVAYKTLDEEILYEELYHAMLVIACNLGKKGVKPGTPVVLYMDKSLEYIASVFGVLKSGGFFVPMNVNDESSRFEKIMSDLDASFIITTQKYADVISAYTKQVNKKIEIIILGKCGSGGSGEQFCYIDYQNENVENDSSSVGSEEDIAYIIYTSGSTGEPKGVAIMHKSILNFMYETVEMYNLDINSRVLSMKQVFFDAIFTDIFCPQVKGGMTILIDKTHIFPRVLSRIVRKEQITHMSMNPSILRLMVESNQLNQEDYSSLKTLSVGGDSVGKEYIRKLKKVLPNVRLFNRYGPTECTVVSSGYEIEKLDDDKPIPIGKPIKNTSYYVFNEDMQLAQKLEVGELYIGGIQLMKQYWNDPGLTRKVLVDNLIKGEVLYKTGDLVFQDENGDYVFYGRVDDVIKRRGYRISLLEVESAISKIDQVDDCICILDKSGSESMIVAVIKKHTELTKEALVHKLVKEVPDFMMPDRFYEIEEMPYTQVGKADRKLVRAKYYEEMLPVLK